jgi:hypothetical protein
MYVTREDFRRLMFEERMRAEFPLWKITFIWGERWDKNPVQTILDVPIKPEMQTVLDPDPGWDWNDNELRRAEEE